MISVVMYNYMNKSLKIFLILFEIYLHFYLYSFFHTFYFLN